jgi:hypothetical protein
LREAIYSLSYPVALFRFVILFFGLGAFSACPPLPPFPEQLLFLGRQFFFLLFREAFLFCLRKFSSGQFFFLKHNGYMAHAL